MPDTIVRDDRTKREIQTENKRSKITIIPEQDKPLPNTETQIKSDQTGQALRERSLPSMHEYRN